MDRQQQGRLAGWRQLGLQAAGMVLLAVSAGIHLDLYLTGYRSIPTIGWLFLLQVIAGFALAAAVLATRSRLAAAAGAGFALSTLGGYLLSVWVGLFGFKEVRTTAGIIAGVIEAAAFTVLALAAVVPGPLRPAAAPASPRTQMVDRALAAGTKMIPAIAALSVVALALLGFAAGFAARTAGGPPAATAGGVTLKTANTGGVTVLTNAKGLTLYWFAPDTPTTSKCTGSCAAYWPPLTGRPEAGPGVMGKLGTIRRPDGSAQATYNARPLYSYIGDSGPGEAHGNNLNLNDSLWYEIRVPG